jgi:hypothetical protein
MKKKEDLPCSPLGILIADSSAAPPLLFSEKLMVRIIGVDHDRCGQLGHELSLPRAFKGTVS